MLAPALAAAATASGLLWKIPLLGAGLSALSNWFQNRRDLRMWRLQNKYNSPEEQMKRLKASGLNPNLVYGSGSVVGNSQSRPETAQTDFGRYSKDMVDIMTQMEALKNLKLQQPILKERASTQEWESLLKQQLTNKTAQDVGMTAAMSGDIIENMSLKNKMLWKAFEQLQPAEIEALKLSNEFKEYENSISGQLKEYNMTSRDEPFIRLLIYLMNRFGVKL